MNIRRSGESPGCHLDRTSKKCPHKKGAKYNCGVYFNKGFLMFSREIQRKHEHEIGEMGKGFSYNQKTTCQCRITIACSILWIRKIF